MANLRIENNLSGVNPPAFLYRKRYNRWQGIPGDGGTGDLGDFQTDNQFFFAIAGEIVNYNSILLALENCPYFVEIIDLVAPLQIPHHAIIRFTPTDPKPSDNLVKAHNSEVVSIKNNNTYSNVWVKCRVGGIRKISGRKNNDLPNIVDIPSDETFRKMYEFSNNDIFEFRFLLNTNESCYYMITMKNVMDTIEIYDNGRTEVQLTRNNPSPQDINITIEPD